ncbi:hypothetical protein ACLB1O_06100 [Escherichia coli]
MAELKYKTINSLKWSALERIFSQGIQLILMLVLARLLQHQGIWFNWNACNIYRNWAGIY